MPYSLTSDDHPQGLTPLHYAAREGQTEIAELILEAKANVRTAVSHTFSMPRMLVCVCVCVCAFSLSSINAMRAQANTPDHSLRTPLHTAVEANHLDVVRLLFNYKADPTYVLSIFG